MKISRRFTASGQDAFAGVEFEARTLEDGRTITAPSHWSLRAVEELAENYLFAEGVPAATKSIEDVRTPSWLSARQPDPAMLATYPQEERTGAERDARQAFDRIVGFWTHSGWLAGYFNTEGDARAYFDEMRALLARQMAGVDDNQWKEAGLNWAYGLQAEGSSRWITGLESGETKPAQNRYANPAQNDTSFESMSFDHPQIESFIAQQVGEEQKLAALATGSRILTQHAGAILSAATKGYEKDNTNRFDPNTNKMLASVLHKAQKAGLPDNVLVGLLNSAKQGFETYDYIAYDLDWDSKAYDLLNIAQKRRAVGVELTALEPGDAVWPQLTRAIWQSADPAIEFATTRREWQTIENRADGLAPAATLNLLAFRQADGSLDIDNFTHAARLLTLTLEIIGATSSHSTRAAAETAFKQRPIALGFGNLAAFLTSAGEAYDSAQGRTTAATIAALLSGVAYTTSAEIAEELGAFPDYAANKEEMRRVLANQRAAIYSRTEGYAGLSISPSVPATSDCRDADLAAAARMAWDQALEEGLRHGFRNASVSSLRTLASDRLLDLESENIKPSPSAIRYRQLASGGMLRTLGRSLPEALALLSYGDAEIADIHAHALGRATLKSAPHINHETLHDHGFDDAALARIEEAVAGSESLRAVFTPTTLGYEFCTQNLGVPPSALEDVGFDLIGWLGYLPSEVEAASRWCFGTGSLDGAPHITEAHAAIFAQPDTKAEIYMASALQPFISSDISLTLFLEQSAGVNDVDALAQLAAGQGLKTISFYRDGSRLSEIVALDLPEIAEEETKPAPVIQQITPALAPVQQIRAGKEPLPDRRHGYTLRMFIEGYEIYLRTAEYPDGRLGEVALEIPAAGPEVSGPVLQLAASLSLGLQYGAPLKELVRSLNEVKSGGPAGAIISSVLSELSSTYSLSQTLVRQDNLPVLESSPGA